MRIGVAGFVHETHTFYPEPTTIKDYEDQGVEYGEEVLAQQRGANSYVGGYLDVLEKRGVEVVPTLNARAGVANRLTRDCFEKYAGEIVQRFRDAGDLDGVLLALHGAMAVDGVDKPEAELTRRVREVVGDIPIMVTLDLHANEDHELTDAADAVFICKQYPHTDMAETGVAAARCMLATLDGTFKPTMAIKKPGVASPSVFQGTHQHPMKLVRDRADEWEQRDGVYYVSVATGFGYADVPDIGASVIAVTNNDPALAQEIVDDVAALIWEHREALASQPLPKPDEAVRTAIELVGQGVRPVLLANHSDRTGASTHILHELLRQEAHRFGYASIWDPAAARQLVEAGVGAHVTVEAGGQGSEYSGEPVRLSGTVTFAGKGDHIVTGPMAAGRHQVCGPTGVLDIGSGSYVAITSFKYQAFDASGFRAWGIPVDDLDMIVVKSRVHFRAYFDQVAGETIVVDAPGLGPSDLRQFDYKNVPDDTYPIGRKWVGESTI